MEIDTRTDVEKEALAKALNSRQRHYDRLHHMHRLIWLKQVPCLYDDGTVVPEYFRLQLLRGSEECLRQITEHGSSTRSVSLHDKDYLTFLDEFEKTGEFGYSKPEVGGE